jgi:preprotein translocase subunit SecD
MRIRAVLFSAASALAMMPARAGALEATVDSLDNIPEALHSEYVQQGDKFVLQVTGMKPEADFQRVQTALNKERNDHNNLKGRVSQLGDRKIEDVVTQLDRIPELEAAAEGKLDEEKINGIVEARVRTKLAPVERERDQFKARVGELEGTVGELTGKERKRLIRDEVRKAAKAAKVTDEALDDALLLGDTVFEIREDDGKVVVKDGTSYTQGIEPSVLFTDLQSKKPHWFGASSGGGSGGNRGGPAGGSNPFSKSGWNMTQQGQAMSADSAKADQLAKAAGHRDAASARKADAK